MGLLWYNVGIAEEFADEEEIISTLK